MLRHSADKAQAVLLGTAKLAEEYETAKDAEMAVSGQEARLGRLREGFPELADKVVEGARRQVGKSAVLGFSELARPLHGSREALQPGSDTMAQGPGFFQHLSLAVLSFIPALSFQRYSSLPEG